MPAGSPGAIKQVLLIAAAGSAWLSTSVQGAQIDAIQEIQVFGAQGISENITASRLNLELVEIPATLDVIDGDAIRARLDTNVLEAVTRSAGFTNEANPGNGHFSIAARGFTGQNAVTKLYDGTQYFTVAGTVTFPFDTWGVEHIEVLKGPSSVLYGQGGIGGAVNIIPQRPEFEHGAAIRLMAGENATSFLGIDASGGLSDTLAYRVNYSRSESDNWVNNGESKAEMLSLSALWQVTEEFSLSARYDRGEQSPMAYFGVPHANGEFIDDFVAMNFNVGDAEVSYDDDAIRLQADWTISPTASLEAELYHLTSDRWWANAEGYVYDDASGLIERWDPLVLGHDIEQTGLRGNLAFSPASAVKGSVGFEINHIDFSRPSNFGPANPRPIDWEGDFDVVDPGHFQPGSLSDLTGARPMLDNWSDVRQRAVFGEAQYQLTDRLALVGALRFDDFDTHYQRLQGFDVEQTVDALTGRIGAVYELGASTAVYGQYATGAEHPSGTVATISGSHREADLVESEQVEIGIKNTVGNTGLQWSIAVFDIVKNDMLIDDPDSGNPDDVILIDEQSSRGIELGVNYALTRNLQVHGNISALDAEIDSGETPTGVPETTWNAGFAWNVTDSLRLIADARYVDERPDDGTPLPNYTVVDASAHWRVNHNLKLALKVDNVTDELYAAGSSGWGTWLVGKPRTVSLVADFDF